MSKQLNALLAKAVAALPAKSPVRVEIEAALAKRAEFTARAQAAWATMRAPGGVHFVPPVEPVKPAKGAKVKAPTKTGPAPAQAKPVKRLQLTASNKMRSARKAPAAPATH
jgi:hypothetical protein